MTSLELEYVSPALEAARDLCLSIPGQYRPGREVLDHTDPVPLPSSHQGGGAFLMSEVPL